MTGNPEKAELGLKKGLTFITTVVEVLQDSHMSSEAFVFRASKKLNFSKGRSRKHVTVLFSDLSGCIAMSEKLDPEEVKEIMSRIFGEIAQVVTKYDGVVEKFVGNAVMALFGVPKAHEDDPVRAIRAAQEIHAVVIDLLKDVFRIKEGDPPEKVEEKAESEIKHLVGREGDVVPYVGSLYSLSYPEVEDVSPGFWKSRLQDATQTIMSALARGAQFLLNS